MRGAGSACNSFKETEVVFLGRAVQDTGTSNSGERYAIGVNAEKYSDGLAFPPVFYPSSTSPEGATAISIGDGEEKSGIDLRLRPARKPATLVIHAVMEDGTPATGSLASIEDLAGTRSTIPMSARRLGPHHPVMGLIEGPTLDDQISRTERVFSGSQAVSAKWHTEC